MGHHLNKVAEAHKKSQIASGNSKGNKPAKKIEELIKLSLNDLIGQAKDKFPGESSTDKNSVQGMKETIKDKFFEAAKQVKNVQEKFSD